MRNSVAAALALLLILTFYACSRDDKVAQDGEEIVIYSARGEHLIRDVLLRFSAETGVKTRYLTDAAEPLMARLEAEGEATAADILMTVDAGNLEQAARRDLLAALDSPILRRNIPEEMRSEESRWFGFSARARTVVYHPERVDAEDLLGYEDLAARRWRKRLCLRSSKKIYNKSLVASLIHHLGEKRTLAMLRGWVRNLALKPFDSDTRAMEAVIAGRCDLALVNSYYYGRLKQKWDKRGEALPLRIHWPPMAPRRGSFGVHMNISGAGVTRHAPHPQSARRFLEWLSEDEAQSLLARGNFEYPVNPAVSVAPEVRAWGAFEMDTMPMKLYREYQPQAVRLMERAGYR